ncbi:hypothetical protein RIR_jg20643.t1 [Rhizophagus irregularis DAOM 181602=DAOM 197198]|nr:hypothetical protein RIR_jg20643.t1 [Rhizophagus irregularis DAOM 181602=DAOM 197198]
MPLGSTKGSFFIITWVSAGKFKNITRLQDVTVNFFLRRTTISAIIFPNINYTTHLLGCKYDLSIPTTILYGILSCIMLQGADNFSSSRIKGVPSFLTIHGYPC